MRYFTADWHCYSESALRDNYRHFRNPDECVEQMLENVNAICTEDDTLIFVGDFINYRPAEHHDWKPALDLLKRIKPKCELVYGNNDYRLLGPVVKSEGDLRKLFLDAGFTAVHGMQLFTVLDGQRTCVTHRAAQVPYSFFGIYGHIHVAGRISGIGVNVGVDVNNFYPVSEHEIIDLRKQTQGYYAAEDSVRLMCSTPFGSSWGIS